jgi:hypothetical protein
MRPNIWTLNRGQWTTTSKGRVPTGISAMSFSPLPGFNFGRACGFQDGLDVLDTRLDGMDRKQYRPTLNRGLESFGPVSGDSRTGQRAPEATRHMPCGLTEPGRQRSRGDDGPDPRKDQRDCGQQMSGQFAKPGGGARVLDLGARGSAHLRRVIRFFIVIATDHRELIRTDARRVQLARGSSGLREMGEQGDDKGVSHFSK